MERIVTNVNAFASYTMFCFLLHIYTVYLFINFLLNISYTKYDYEMLILRLCIDAFFFPNNEHAILIIGPSR